MKSYRIFGKDDCLDLLKTAFNGSNDANTSIDGLSDYKDNKQGA